VLQRAERRLRRYDKALRLRVSSEQPHTVLIERKTFRGRIGSVGPDGLLWSPDVGRRREEGHVLVGSLPLATVDPGALLDALKYADTWRRWDTRAEPLWRRVEQADEQRRSAQVRARKDGLRYKASELYDRYVWRYGSRVSVPSQIA
jgi:hypothetical protein